MFLFDTPVEKLVFPNEQLRAAVANVRHPTPIVLLLLDEFPVIDLENGKGEIDAGRYPNFACLARRSVWFRNTTTVSASTTFAVPAILTGSPPKRGALPIVQDYPNNLFTLLGGRYRMEVTESQTRLCPKRLCKRKHPDTASRLSSLYSDARIVYLHLLAPPALEEPLPVIDESTNFGADTTGNLGEGTVLPKIDMRTFYKGRVRAFNRFVASFRPPGRGPPTLYFIHVLLPHTPWVFLPDGRGRALARTNAPGRVGERWYDSDLAVQAWQRHLLQVGYTDRLLGLFLRRLHETGLWDKALIIVTPDHGIASAGATCAATRRGPTWPSWRSRRSSSSSPASRTGASSTGTS